MTPFSKAPDAVIPVDAGGKNDSRGGSYQPAPSRTDIEVYMAAPESRRPAITLIQRWAREQFGEAKILGMPRDTFDEIREARDQMITEVIG